MRQHQDGSSLLKGRVWGLCQKQIHFKEEHYSDFYMLHVEEERLKSRLCSSLAELGVCEAEVIPSAHEWLKSMNDFVGFYLLQITHRQPQSPLFLPPMKTRYQDIQKRYNNYLPIGFAFGIGVCMHAHVHALTFVDRQIALILRYSCNQIMLVEKLLSYTTCKLQNPLCSAIKTKNLNLCPNSFFLKGV